MSLIVLHLSVVLALMGCRTVENHSRLDSTLPGPTSEPSHVAMLPNVPDAIVTSTWSGDIVRWNLSSKRAEWTASYAQSIHHFEPSFDGRFVYVAGNQGLVRILNAHDGSEVLNLDQPKFGAAIRVSGSIDGRKLAAVFLDEMVSIYDLEKKIVEQSIPGVFEWPVIRALEFSVDSKRLLIADVVGVRELDLLKSETIRTFQDKRHCQGTQCVPWLSAVAISRDRRLLAVGSVNEVRLFNTESGREILTLGGHIGDVSRIRFLDGDRVIESIGLDGSVFSWNVPSHTLQSFYQSDSPKIWQTAVTSDHKFLVGIDRVSFDIVVSPANNLASTIINVKESWSAQLRVDTSEAGSIRLGFGSIGNQNVPCAKDTTQQCSESESCLLCDNNVRAFIDAKTELGNLKFYARNTDGGVVEVNLACSKNTNGLAKYYILYDCIETLQLGR